MGYFRVTGKALFDWLTLGEVLMLQVKDMPVRPTKMTQHQLGALLRVVLD